jgi:hypothetical protein
MSSFNPSSAGDARAARNPISAAAMTMIGNGIARK